MMSDDELKAAVCRIFKFGEDKWFDYADEFRQLLAAERAAERERFQVSVQTMRESKGESFMVCIDHPDRPLDAKPWDGGRMTPYSTPTRENAEMEAETWRRFFVSGDASHVNAMEAIRKLGEKRGPD